MTDDATGYRLEFALLPLRLTKSKPAKLPMLNSAANIHWREKQRHDAAWKTAVWGEVKRAGAPHEPLKKARVIFTRHSTREPDHTNLVWSFKVIEDALRYTHVLLDDKPENYYGGQPEYRWEKSTQRNQHIIVEVYEQ